MTCQMLAARNALQFNTTSTLMFIREITSDAEATNANKNDSDAAVCSRTRDSMGTKLARKMKGLFSRKKQRQLTSTEEDQMKKEALQRQYTQSGAFVQMGRRRW
ncbi:hypothetical protein PHYBOEH_000405 [Phytophthora boehmeriae]|uniref:Uncharacterized protein n=1 Tax=Phytophthora boehmeriae TaxID=109152 RepID=A0A8T1WW31_9STRA|nr:hypothetical protein PHYBOEH_000405 [Phytophthora boehmeriae]